MTKLYVSQIFGPSFQGEGSRTGVQTLFLRLFGCNLRCQGFFQDNPTDPSTYISPINFDPKLIKVLDDVPVIERGCDTLYAIDPRFKHLRKSYEVDDIITELTSYLPDGRWGYKNRNLIDLCITGGEPLLQQKALVEMISKMEKLPNVIQIETNGTQKLSKEFNELTSDICNPTSYQFNVSLKLFNVSGEDYTFEESY